MRKLLALAIMFVIFSITAIGQAKLENIKDLIVTVKIDSIAKDALRKAIVYEINRSDFSKKDTALIRNYFTTALVPMEQEIVQKLIFRDITEIFDNKFSGREIKAMLKFYKSSAGQKELSLFPNPYFNVKVYSIISDKYLPEIISSIDSLKTKIKTNQ